MYYYINENADLAKGIESFNLSEKTTEKLKNNGYMKIEDLVDRRFNNSSPELRRLKPLRSPAPSARVPEAAPVASSLREGA